MCVHTSLALAVILGPWTLLSHADNKPDFTGNWELDVAKSDFGKATPPTRMTLTARQEGKKLHASQTSYDQEGSRTIDSDWITDGKAHPVEGMQGGTVLCKWDSSTLRCDRKWSGGQYEERIELSLSGDGKVATERVHAKNPNGTNNSTLVWTRK